MIYSRVSGQGSPVVLLHGYGEDLSLWENLGSYLSQQFQVIALDLPGFGQSQRLTGSFSIDDVAISVYDHLRNELELESFTVLGHSLGGYVTLALAEIYPRYLSGFGLINSTALPDSPEKKVNRQRTADFIRKHKAEFFLNSFVPQLFFEGNRDRHEKEIAKVIAMGKNLEEDLLANYMLAMRDRPSRLHLLSEFENVLFVGGEKDSGLSYKDYEKQISGLKNQANAYLLKNIGHMSMYEAPEELQTVCTGFLKSL